MNIATAVICITGAVILFPLFIFAVMIIKMTAGRKRAEHELSAMKLSKITGFGTVDTLTIVPVFDFYAADDGYSTGEGVSYVIRAGNTTILFDLGDNKRKEHPSPLLKNLQESGIQLSEINQIFISHLHRDHVGGLAEEKKGRFAVSRGKVALTAIPVYSPGPVSPSEYNPGPVVQIIKEPEVLGDGIASTGIYPRSLFLIGYVAEQSLAVNVRGKGIVLIIGCGHPGIEQIIKRCSDVFDEPVYGIIGGLHLPVNGGRFMAGPLNLQNIIGVDRKPLRGIKEDDVYAAIDAIKKINPRIVSLSPHDSSDWTIGKFKEAFGDKYVELLVGKPVQV